MVFSLIIISLIVIITIYILYSAYSHMSLLKVFLAIGIAVLLVVFIGYGLYVFYEPPQYGYADTSSCFTQFPCENLTAPCYVNETINGSPDKVVPVPAYTGCYEKVYASAQYQKCMEDQNDCNNKINQTSENYFHARNSFYILIVLAIVAIIVGARLWQKEGIGSGFLGGGVLTVLWALIYTPQYWTTLNKYLRLLAVGAVLVLLVWIGYKKLETRFAKPKRARRRRR
jgi:hypothetical protein